MIKTYNKKNYSLKMGAIHHWIKARKFKPDRCECCGEIKVVELSNISNEYKRDIMDYEWLCRKYHTLKDGRSYWFRKGERDNLGRVKLACRPTAKQYYESQLGIGND